MPTKTPRQSGASVPSVTTPHLPTYSHGDIVLAKVKGHPAWPARIVDPYASPLNLRDERKIAQKNSYLVKFFKTADFAWMNAKEMSMLEPPEIRAFINNPNKKGADLKAAYQIALAPEAWEAELESYQQEYEEEQKALEIDELEPTEPDQVAQAPPAKPKQKRKRPSEVKPPAASTKKRKSEVRFTPNGSAKPSTTPEPPVTPAVKKRSKKKEEPVAPIDGESIVRDWRHRLQRVFLGKTEVTEEMMPEIDTVFSDIEKFEMKTEWLTSSKLAKVLKRLGVLDDSKVPLDSKYHIRARARALQEKWRQALGLGEESNRPRTAEATEQSKPDVSPNTQAKEAKKVASPKKTRAATETNGKQSVDPCSPSTKQTEENESKPVEDSLDDSNKAEIQAVPEPDEAEPMNKSVRESSRDAKAKSPQPNGHHVNTRSDDAIDGPEKLAMDVEMADPNAEKSQVEENDDGERMDCAESPEPTTAESNEADKEKVA